MILDVFHLFVIMRTHEDVHDSKNEFTRPISSFIIIVLAWEAGSPERKSLSFHASRRTQFDCVEIIKGSGPRASIDNGYFDQVSLAQLLQRGVMKDYIPTKALSRGIIRRVDSGVLA